MINDETKVKAVEMIVDGINKNFNTPAKQELLKYSLEQQKEMLQKYIQKMSELDLLDEESEKILTEMQVLTDETIKALEQGDVYQVAKILVDAGQTMLKVNPFIG